MKSFREHWLSDPSCYPLIAIMSSAALFVVGVGASCLMYNPDVRIDPNKVRRKLMKNPAVSIILVRGSDRCLLLYDTSTIPECA